MPNYDYECKSCGYKFEAFQKMTDKPLNNCPKCQKKVDRLIGSGAGIIFKGSGFYATDYRKKPKSQNPLKPRSTKDSSCPKAKDGCTACNP